LFLSRLACRKRKARLSSKLRVCGIENQWCMLSTQVEKSNFFQST
jgi:hypothetical protein